NGRHDFESHDDRPHPLTTVDATVTPPPRSPHSVPAGSRTGGEEETVVEQGVDPGTRPTYDSSVSRLEPVRPDDPGVDDDTAALLRQSSSRSGRLSNVMATVANHPPALRAIRAFADTIYRDGLLARDRRELVYLTASVENSCHY